MDEHAMDIPMWPILIVGGLAYAAGAVSALLLAGLLAVWRRLRG